MHRGTRRRTAPVPRPPPASRAATRGLAKAGAVRRNGAATRARRAIAATIGAREEEAKRPDKDRPRPPPAEPRVNLNSPFAKLLALKPLLQGRDKNQ